jgi:hypothetical protein
MGRASALALVAAVLGAAPASAESCTADIAQFRQTLQQKEDAGAGVVGSAPQSIDAQLEHQPTPASVARAEKNAKDQVVALLREAEAYNAQGRRRHCLAALERARLLLNP